MEKTELDIVVSLLKDRVEHLIQFNNKLQNENVRLHKQIDSLNVQNSEQLSELDSLRRKIESNTLTDAFVVGMGSKKEAQNTIRTILREVDDCIALINK